MFSTVRIAPSILSANFMDMERDIRMLEEAGADIIHVDVMDGHFVPNLTIGVPFIKQLCAITDLPIDVHLMISHPKQYIRQFAEAGAEIITFHVECDDDIDETITEIEKYGVKPALSLKPGTPVECLYPYLDRLYMVLVMTVEPGFGGQKFMADQMEKLRALRAKRPELILEVDGGVNRETAPICRENGADVAVAGTAVFRAENIPAEIALLRGE